MFIISISIISTALFMALSLLLLDKEKSSFKKIKIKNKKLRKKDDIRIKLYNVYTRTPLISLITNRCINSINNSAEIKIRNKKEASDITNKTVSIFIFMSLVISPFVTNFRILITAIVALVFITISSIDYFSGKVKTQLLIHLVDFLDILRNKYFECGNRVDDALSETILSLDIDRHFDIIDEAETLLETIENPDSDLALRDYYQIAPNKYFVLLAGLLFINKENGDLIDYKGSRFAKALTDLSSELKEEIKLRDKLNFSLKSLNIIAIVPLFIISPLRIWASKSFYPLQKFYESSLGFLTEFIVLITVILSFIGLSKIQSFREDISEDSINYSLENTYKRIKKIVDFIKPKKHSNRYKKIMKQKEAALEFSKIEYHYTKKFLFLVFILLLGILVSSYISHISKTAILENPTMPEGFLGGEVNEKELIKATETSKMDKKMIQLLLNGVDSDTIIEQLENKYGLLGENKTTAVERIITKYENYQASNFNYKDIIAIYLFSILGFFIPDILLLMRKKIIKIDAMNEVSKFQLICTLMMHIKQIGVDTLLEWIERFSIIYKTPIQDAIMDYDAGAELALLKLKNASKNDEFRKIIEHMLSAVNRISIERAFEDLESEKNYYKEKRQTIYQRIIAKKISMGKIIGFIPTYSVILIYFMLPLIYQSTKEINMYFDMFTK